MEEKAETTTGASTNPFDFDVDFGKVQKRRERAMAAKEAQKAPEEQGILHQMDQDAAATTNTTVSTTDNLPNTGKKIDPR